MARHAELTREIRAGPSGPKVGAFFDLDRTLVAGFSAVALFRDRLLRGQMSPRELADTVAAAASFQLGRTGFSGFVGAAANLFRGLSEQLLEEIGLEVFERQLADSVYPESRALVRAHHEMGHSLVVVSSATRYQVEPVARSLGIERVLCTRLEVEGGVLTGRVVRPLCFGEGKREAAEAIAREGEIELPQSWFYTDSHDDLPLLEVVGRPRPLNPDRRLTAIAQERGWPVRRFRSRGAPGAAELARTGLALGSLAPALLAGAGSGLLNRSRRVQANVGTATWGELGTALAGLELEVSGEEHLWSARPCVFLYNPTSAVDGLLLCRLLRADVAGIGARELRATPLLGRLLEGLVAWSGHERGEAIARLERSLRAGVSVVEPLDADLAPTRESLEAACRARVSVVPIVLHNVRDALPPGGLLIRPVALDVTVRAPRPAPADTPGALEAERAALARLYADLLAD